MKPWSYILCIIVLSAQVQAQETLPLPEELDDSAPQVQFEEEFTPNADSGDDTNPMILPLPEAQASSSDLSETTDTPQLEASNEPLEAAPISPRGQGRSLRPRQRPSNLGPTQPSVWSQAEPAKNNPSNRKPVESTAATASSNKVQSPSTSQITYQWINTLKSCLDVYGRPFDLCPTFSVAGIRYALSDKNLRAGLKEFDSTITSSQFPGGSKIRAFGTMSSEIRRLTGVESAACIAETGQFTECKIGSRKNVLKWIRARR